MTGAVIMVDAGSAVVDVGTLAYRTDSLSNSTRRFLMISLLSLTEMAYRTH